MTDKRVLYTTATNRQHIASEIAGLPDGYRIEVKPAGRTLDQNSAQWPILAAFSKQKQWPVNGVMCWLTDEEWKDVLTAAYEQDINPRLAAGINGGVVMLGRRTSKFKKEKFSGWLEFLHATAAIMGVQLDRN